MTPAEESSTKTDREPAARVHWTHPCAYHQVNDRKGHAATVLNLAYRRPRETLAFTRFSTAPQFRGGGKLLEIRVDLFLEQRKDENFKCAGESVTMRGRAEHLLIGRPRRESDACAGGEGRRLASSDTGRDASHCGRGRSSSSRRSLRNHAHRGFYGLGGRTTRAVPLAVNLRRTLHVSQIKSSSSTSKTRRLKL